MKMIRNGQIQGAAKGAVRDQVKFMAKVFGGVAA